MKRILIVVMSLFFLTACKKSTEQTNIVSDTVPVKPDSLVATVIGASQVNLIWSDNSSNELGYKVQRKSGSGNFADIASLDSNASVFNDTGLTANTDYTYRVYAFNSYGNSLYSNEQTITTEDSVTINTSVTICNQTWSTQNLNVSHYRNGDVIPQVTDDLVWSSLTTGAWCWYNNDSAGYGAKYGKLYNFYAVKDPRGLAPEGWHVPSDSEWAVLDNCLGGSLISGGALKEAGLTHWRTPNAGATNSSGFAALPGGYRFNDGTFYFNTTHGYFWTATDFNLSNAWFRNVYYFHTELIRNYLTKVNGYAVRIIKD